MEKLFLLCLVISGCRHFDSSYGPCTDDREEFFGATYAYTGITTDKFDAFQNHCRESGFKVPSKEKFFKAYNSTMKFICANESAYFKAAYMAYNNDENPIDCREFANTTKKMEIIKKDAREASQCKKIIDSNKRTVERAERYKDEKVNIKELNTDSDQQLQKLKTIFQKYNIQDL